MAFETFHEADMRGRHRKHPLKTHIMPLNKPNQLVELHAKEFSVDLKVQRTLNEARADAIAADFHPASLGMVTASKRADGHIYLLDGAHRVSAARKAKYDGLIATRLFTDLTLAEEATLFLSTNTTKTVSPIDKFKVRVTRGDKSAVTINSVLKRYDLHVDWQASKKHTKVVSSIVTLEKIYHGVGVYKPGEYTELLEKVIKTIVDAYGPDQLTREHFGRPILEGVAIMYAHFGSRIDPARMVGTLQSMVPAQINARARNTRDAEGGGTLGFAASRTLHKAYNKYLRAGGNKLPDWHEVDPRNQAPVSDPLEVDPAQYVIEDAMEPAEK